MVFDYDFGCGGRISRYMTKWITPLDPEHEIGSNIFQMNDVMMEEEFYE